MIATMSYHPLLLLVFTLRKIAQKYRPNVPCALCSVFAFRHGFHDVTDLREAAHARRLFAGTRTSAPPCGRCTRWTAATTR